MGELILRFGLSLDGQRSEPARSRLGVATVGPLGLLNVLETKLGLLGEAPAQSERVVQYCEALRAANSANRFYYQSFQVDALGTSAVLLSWRDHWHLHGWNGEAPASAPARIRDMAAVEEKAVGSLFPCIGERLLLVESALVQRKVAIERIELCDPLERFPLRWQKVLALLPVADQTQGEQAVALFTNGFLGKLQKHLIQASEDKAQKKLAFEHDGTVLVVQGDTSLISAAWLGHQLGEHQTLMLAPAESGVLESVLTSQGGARNGFRASSAYRPAQQVLSLALELLWQPLNFYALVQFLTHPVCPVPNFARLVLARKVAQYPGIGGHEWDKALQNIREYFKEDADAVIAKVSYWVENERFLKGSGAPLEAVEQRVSALTDFFRGRQADQNPIRQVSAKAGLAQCMAAGRAVRALVDQGLRFITPRQLEVLVNQATAQGTDHPLQIAQVGASLIANDPGAALFPVDQVVWWHMVAPNLPQAYPWSQSEISALENCGVHLPTVAELLDWLSSDWLRPIMAARKRLVLLLPPPGEEVHPMWQMVLSVLEKQKPDSPHAIVLALQDLMATGAPYTQALAHTPLPLRKRWWQMPAEIHIPKREKESYSSLNTFLFNPCEWLLKYPARLNASSVVSLVPEPLMFGNLSHRLMEKLYARDDALTMPRGELQTWYEKAIEQLIQEEGALLLASGKAVERKNFQRRLFQAMVRLREHLINAGAIVVEAERQLSGHFVGGGLVGSADIYVEGPNDQLAVVDLKWGGDKVRKDDLRNNTHLQLAIYAHMLSQTQRWPELAFFILSKAILLAQHNQFFSQAQVHAPKNADINTAAVWQSFLETWKWRREQLDSGQVEVCLKGIEETAESVPPAGSLPMLALNESYSDYLALAGWREA